MFSNEVFVCQTKLTAIIVFWQIPFVHSLTTLFLGPELTNLSVLHRYSIGFRRTTESVVHSHCPHLVRSCFSQVRVFASFTLISTTFQSSVNWSTTILIVVCNSLTMLPVLAAVYSLASSRSAQQSVVYCCSRSNPTWVDLWRFQSIFGKQIKSLSRTPHSIVPFSIFFYLSFYYSYYLSSILFSSIMSFLTPSSSQDAEFCDLQPFPASRHIENTRPIWMCSDLPKCGQTTRPCLEAYWRLVRCYEELEYEKNLRGLCESLNGRWYQKLVRRLWFSWSITSFTRHWVIQLLVCNGNFDLRLHRHAKRIFLRMA